MSDAVQVAFECLPLRSIGRLDAPLDASAEYRNLSDRIKAAIETHGAHNSYFLTRGTAQFQLTNDPAVGVLCYEFDGTVLTDPTDMKTVQVDLAVAMESEACDWLTRSAAEWFEETVRRAVAVEFDRYIAAGDLAKSFQRLARLQHECEAAEGYLGMYL